MNRLTVILTFLFSALAFSCRNGDDIGYFYGQWVVESFTVDDELIYDGEIANDEGIVLTWRFQNDLVQLTYSNAIHDFRAWTGTWHCDDITYMSVINFNFPYIDAMPAFLHLSENMTVDSEWDSSWDGDWMRWTYLGPEGQQCVMVMHKLG